MAGLLDVCFLLLTSAFFLGAILGTALIARKCRALIDATKASLEERGWVVFPQHESGSLSIGRGDHNGDTIVLVKTRKKRMDQERYLDATQRGVMKALQASTFGAPQPPSQTARARASPDPSLSSSSLGPAGAHPVQYGARERSPVAGGGGGGDSGSGMMDETSMSEKIKQWTRKDLSMAADEIASSSSEKIRRLKDTLSSRWY